MMFGIMIRMLSPRATRRRSSDLNSHRKVQWPWRSGGIRHQDAIVLNQDSTGVMSENAKTTTPGHATLIGPCGEVERSAFSKILRNISREYLDRHRTIDSLKKPL